MLEAYAGEDTWRDGIRTYISRHKYSNTTSNDLWRAVEEAGAAGLVTIAHDFTLQPGVPLVRAEARCVGGNTALNLTQSEFSRDRKEQTSANPQRWHVPLIIQPVSSSTRRMCSRSLAVSVRPLAGAIFFVDLFLASLSWSGISSAGLRERMTVCWMTFYARGSCRA